MEQPDYCKKKHLAYLDDMRAAGHDPLKLSSALYDNFDDLDGKQAATVWKIWLNSPKEA